MKRPAFQFYPADWRKDMALQSCSIAARGLWIDILCIAHECEPYGHLTVNGRPMTLAQIGRHVGLTERECEKLVEELDAAGVLSKTGEGAIFSRRMVRDEHIREVRSQAGRLGGNPNLVAGKVGGLVNHQSKRSPTPSSSSSSSSSDNPKPRKRGRGVVHGFPPGFEAFWSAYPRKDAKDGAAKAFARIGPDEALQAAILAAVERQKASDQWTRDGGKFVPYASTWLNGRRWEDELPGTSKADDIFAGAL